MKDGQPASRPVCPKTKSSHHHEGVACLDTERYLTMHMASPTGDKMISDHNSHEEVHLVIPARPELLGVARLAAASLASTIDFSLDEIEDLKIAIDELCHQLLRSDSSEGSMSITYSLATDSMEVEGTGPGPGEPTEGSSTSHPLSNRILEAVTDQFSIELGINQARFRMLKRRAART